MEEKKEVELNEYIGVIVKRKWTIIITTLVCFFSALFFISIVKPVYRVESFIEIGVVPSGYIVDPQSMIPICESELFKNKITEKISSTREKIRIKARAQGPLVILAINSRYPDEAVEILNAATNIIVEEHNAIYKEKTLPLFSEINNIQEQMEILKSRKDDISHLFYLTFQISLKEVQKELIPCKKTKVVLPAGVSGKPVQPRPEVSIPISVILGLVLGVLIAFFQEYLSKRKL